MANTRSMSGDPLDGTSLAGFANDLPGMHAFQRGDHPHLSGSHSASGRRPRKLSARRGGVRAAVRASPLRSVGKDVPTKVHRQKRI
jgi:hypothetical protein